MKYFYYLGLFLLANILIFPVLVMEDVFFKSDHLLGTYSLSDSLIFYIAICNSYMIPAAVSYFIISIPVIAWGWKGSMNVSEVKRVLFVSLGIFFSIILTWIAINSLAEVPESGNGLAPVQVKDPGGLLIP
jgi:hypothetical protein